MFLLGDVISELMERIAMLHTFNPITNACVRCGTTKRESYAGRTKCEGTLPKPDVRICALCNTPLSECCHSAALPKSSGFQD